MLEWIPGLLAKQTDVFTLLAGFALQAGFAMQTPGSVPCVRYGTPLLGDAATNV